MKKTNMTIETVAQLMQSPEDLARCSWEPSIVALLVDQDIRFLRRSGQISVEQEELLRTRLTEIRTSRVIGFSR